MKPTFDEFMAEFRREANSNDPFWIVREHTRLQQVLADEMTQLANAAHSRNEQERADEMPSFGRYIEG